MKYKIQWLNFSNHFYTLVTSILGPSNSLMLCLCAESGNSLEKYAINLYLPFCSWYSAEPHFIFEVTKTRIICPLVFGIASTGASVKSFFIISKAFCCYSPL